MKQGDELICKRNYYGPEYGRSFIITLLILFSDTFKIYLKKRIFKKNKIYQIRDSRSLSSMNDYYNINDIWFDEDYLSNFFIVSIKEYRKLKLKKLNEQGI